MRVGHFIGKADDATALVTFFDVDMAAMGSPD
jgi:hypothetical protein